MEYIERQTPDLEFIRERAVSELKGVNRKLGLDRSNTNLLGLLYDDALCYAGYMSVLEPNSSDICKYLKLAAQAVTALFVIAFIEPGRIELPVGDGSPISFPAVEPNSETHVAK
jgi:hypothetical protein